MFYFPLFSSLDFFSCFLSLELLETSNKLVGGCDWSRKMHHTSVYLLVFRIDLKLNCSFMP